ncbi:MAG TPA: TonB-dependent receptor [Terracidiphilus sp.]
MQQFFPPKDQFATEKRLSGLWQRCSLFISMAIVAVLFAFVPATHGQENAAITGTVTDASGAVIPNANLQLTDTATGQIRQSTANGAGSFSFANLAHGDYNLTVTAPGFQKYSKTGIVVNVAQTLQENVLLAVGSQAQTVTVEANALQVQTETSEVSTLINGTQVEQLATNGRNITSLAALGLGVSNNLPQFGGIDALTSSNAIEFNGTRQTHNIYLVDGAEQNDRGCGGCFMNLPSQDAIAEFRTLDSNYSPDYGIGSGGTITMVIKSGTKQFHGEVYEFNRNTDYNANDYFVKKSGNDRPRFQLNEPGGNFGGPIPFTGDRTFFFLNEEWRRLIQGSSPTIANTIMASNFPTAGQNLTYTPPNGVAPLVPKTTDPAKLAIYSTDGLTPGAAFPNNVIPANLMDPNSVLEVNSGAFPHPNLGTNQYIASIPQSEDVREDVVRIDHNINKKFQLMGHFLHDAMSRQFFPPLWGDSSYPTVGTAMENPSYTAVIRLTQTYSPSLLNETSFLYGGNKIRLTPIPGQGGSFTFPSGWNGTSFFPVADNASQGMPEIDLQGSPLSVNWSESYFPWKNGYEGFEYRDDLSWNKGHHQFKFGFSWLHDYKNQQLQANTQGTASFNSSNKNFSGDSYVDFLLGDANSFTQLQVLAGKHWVNNNYGFYGNDNWHVRPNLVLNLGLRFDGLPHAYERYNAFSNFVQADYDRSLGYPLSSADGTIDPAFLSTFSATGSQGFYLNGIREAGVNGFPRGNVQNTYFTWQPRLGFSWDLLGDGKTVVRGGYGVFYERVQGNDVYNAALNPPFAYQPSAQNVYFSNPNTSALTGTTTSQTFPSTLTSINYNYPPPGTEDFSLGIQRQLAPSVIAQLQYVGSDGWDQNDDRAVNTLPLNDLTDRQAVAGGANANLYRNYPGYSSITQEENETHFNYNSLQAGIRIENRHGVTAQFGYTWSHNIDEVSNDLNGLSNPYDPKYDWGSDTSFDRRHIFNASYVYALPWYKNSGNALQRQVLGGWEVSGITSVMSGLPLNITYNGSDTVGLGGGFTNRPDKVGKVTYPKTAANWFSPSAYADPTPFWLGGGNQGFGNTGKDSALGPGQFNWNLSLFKVFPLTSHEGPRLELRFESFNTFNHTQFTSIDSASKDSNFGQVTADYGPRLLELGGKFVF